MAIGFNRRIQMMDAVMVLRNSDESFGNVIGQAKAEMEPYGKVWRATELDSSQLPESTAEYDLFMDYSNFWRVRYISCKVESAGENRWAIRLKEGNRSSRLRDIFFITVLVAAAICWIIPSFLTHIAVFAVILADLYFWIYPSKKAQRTVRAIATALEK